MMTSNGPLSHQPQPENDRSSRERGQAERIDGGLRAESITVRAPGRSVTPRLWIVPLATTAASGILTALADNSVYLFAGLIAAATYYYAQVNRKRSRQRDK